MVHGVAALGEPAVVRGRGQILDRLREVDIGAVELDEGQAEAGAGRGPRVGEFLDHFVETLGRGGEIPLVVGLLPSCQCLLGLLIRRHRLLGTGGTHDERERHSRHPGPDNLREYGHIGVARGEGGGVTVTIG